MDIISEILETDKLAEEKIINAHKLSEKILDEADKKCIEIKNGCVKRLEQYKLKKQAETSEEIEEKALKAHSAATEKIILLDKLFEEKGDIWAEEIFDRIISM